MKVVEVCSQSEVAPCAEPQSLEGDRVSFDTNRVPDGTHRVSVDIHRVSNDTNRVSHDTNRVFEDINRWPTGTLKVRKTKGKMLP